MTSCLTVPLKEAAAMLGVSRWTLMAMEERGEIHIARFGRKVLVPRAEIDRILSPKPVPVVDSGVGSGFQRIRKIKLRPRLTA